MEKEKGPILSTPHMPSTVLNTVLSPPALTEKKILLSWSHDELYDD